MEEINLDNSPKKIEEGDQSTQKISKMICIIIFFSLIFIVGSFAIWFFSLILSNYVNYSFDKYNCTVVSIETGDNRIIWSVSTNEGWLTYIDKNTKSTEKYIDMYLINSTYPCYWDDVGDSEKMTWHQFKPNPLITSVISISLACIIISFCSAILIWLCYSGTFKTCYSKIIDMKKNIHYNEMHDEL